MRPGHDVKLHCLNIVIDDVARRVQSVMQSNRVLDMTLNCIRIFMQRFRALIAFLC